MTSKSPSTVSPTGYHKGASEVCSALEMKPRVQKSLFSQCIFLLCWQSKKKLMSHLQSLKPQAAALQYKTLMCSWCGGAWPNLWDQPLLNWFFQPGRNSPSQPLWTTKTFTAMKHQKILLIFLFLEDGVLHAHPFTLELYVNGWGCRKR